MRGWWIDMLLSAALACMSLLLVAYAAPTSGDGERPWYSDLAETAAPLLHSIVAAGSQRCGYVKELFGLTYEQLQEKNVSDAVRSLSVDLITPSGPQKINITSANSTIPRSDGYNPKNQMVIIVHGFMESSEGEMVQEISQAFLDRTGYNIMALDGGQLLNIMYFRSTTYVRFMGEKLGQVLAGLVNDSYANPDSITIVGHSLGAHIAGISGKEFHRITGSRVARITGLDPAGPCFSNVEEEARLHRGDAEYVDVIHTNGGFLGLKEPLGHQDYFPNGGSVQPGCVVPPCCHTRAWQLYAASVRDPQAFPARRCRGWETYRADTCEDGATSHMGLGSTPAAPGSYYLYTADAAPYHLESAAVEVQVSS